MNWFADLPSTVRIGPYDIKVSIVDATPDEDDWGVYYDDQCLICLATGAPNGPFAVDSVLHEILHAVYRMAKLAEGDGEERVVSLVSVGLTQIFRDNPELLEWIKVVLSGSDEPGPVNETRFHSENVSTAKH